MLIWQKSARRFLWLTGFSLTALFIFILFFPVSRAYISGEVQFSEKKWEKMLGEYISYHNYKSETGIAEYYTDIPQSYAGSKVELYSSATCATIQLDLCQGQSSCQVSVTPGQRLEFKNTWTTDAGASCASATTIYTEAQTSVGVAAVAESNPVCGNGSCETNETCANCSADCGSCNPVCGNGTCETGESCANCSSDCGVCDSDNGGGSWVNGSSCSSSSQCQSGNCGSAGVCCLAGYWCCSQDSHCASASFCEKRTFRCASKKDNGWGCEQNSWCKSGHCVYEICRAASTYCGDYHCDSGESCRSCPDDCEKCLGASGGACGIDDDCQSGYCVHDRCRSAAVYCGDGFCEESEVCSNCPADCGRCQPLGGHCAAPKECAAEFCVHGFCSDKNIYCGDNVCDSAELYETCPKDCQAKAPKYPILKLSLAQTKVSLKAGESFAVKINLKNEGQAPAGGLNWQILNSQPEIVAVEPAKKDLGALALNKELNAAFNLKAKKPGSALIILHIRGDNLGSLARQIKVEVETDLNLDLPESIFLQPNQLEDIGIFLINQGNNLVLAKGLTMASLDPSVVSVEAGATMEIKGQGNGLKPDGMFTTQSQDILKGIFPQPKIKANKIGQTELLFKLLYGVLGDPARSQETLEKKVPVEVGVPTAGTRADLNLQLVPAGLVLERNEARLIKVVLKNQGSKIIKSGRIEIINSDPKHFGATKEITFGAIKPGAEATAEIEVVGAGSFSLALDELAKKGDLSVNGALSLKGRYETLDGGKFDLGGEIKLALVEYRKKCSPEDVNCQKAVACLIELSNSMSCTLELADIIPYLDKPVAAVLATADVCEIGKRVETGDTIGAAVSSVLLASDFADNAAEAVPGAGNAVSVFADTVEGAADCTEGFVHDAFDQYCAEGSGEGYTGCAKKVLELFADNSAKYAAPEAASRAVVAIVGSPVAIKVVDDKGRELTGKDRVLVLQKGELKLIFIKNPNILHNVFNFQLTGFNEGKYNLTVAIINQGKVVAEKELKDQPIKVDETVEIPLVVKTKKGDLTGLLVGAETKKLSSKIKEGKTIFIVLAAALILLAVYLNRQKGIKKIILIVITGAGILLVLSNLFFLLDFFIF